MDGSQVPAHEWPSSGRLRCLRDESPINTFQKLPGIRISLRNATVVIGITARVASYW